MASTGIRGNLSDHQLVDSSGGSLSNSTEEINDEKNKELHSTSDGCSSVVERFLTISQIIKALVFLFFASLTTYMKRFIIAGKYSKILFEMTLEYLVSTRMTNKLP